jgi:hypothetical protein
LSGLPTSGAPDMGIAHDVLTAAVIFDVATRSRGK